MAGDEPAREAVGWLDSDVRCMMRTGSDAKGLDPHNAARWGLC
jgi:hypothetical protein